MIVCFELLLILNCLVVLTEMFLSWKGYIFELKWLCVLSCCWFWIVSLLWLKCFWVGKFIFLSWNDCGFWVVVDIELSRCCDSNVAELERLYFWVEMIVCFELLLTLNRLVFGWLQITPIDTRSLLSRWTSSGAVILWPTWNVRWLVFVLVTWSPSRRSNETSRTRRLLQETLCSVITLTPLTFFLLLTQQQQLGRAQFSGFVRRGRRSIYNNNNNLVISRIRRNDVHRNAPLLYLKFMGSL